jgi:IstB-like ATP binding protein
MRGRVVDRSAVDRLPVERPHQPGEPEPKAKFVKFTTIYDPKQMPGQREPVLSWPYVEGLRMTAAEDLMEIIMRRYERASSLLTSNRPVDDWGKLLGDSAAVTAMLDRLLHHGHVLKCGPRSWRTKTDLPPQEAAE